MLSDTSFLNLLKMTFKFFIIPTPTLMAFTGVTNADGPSPQPWSTLVEGGKERYRPPGKLTLELVLANQNKINFYVYGLCSLPSGPIRFLTSFC